MSLAGTLLALSLLVEPGGGASSELESGVTAAPDEASDEYEAPVGSLLLGRGWESATGSPTSEFSTLKLVIDSVHRERPFSFRASVQVSGSELSAEAGGKLLAPPLGPVRGYAAACAGGALRDQGPMVSVSGALGVDVRLGRSLVLILEAEARYAKGSEADADAGDGVDSAPAPPWAARFAALVGVGIPF